MNLVRKLNESKNISLADMQYNSEERKLCYVCYTVKEVKDLFTKLSSIGYRCWNNTDIDPNMADDYVDTLPIGFNMDYDGMCYSLGYNVAGIDWNIEYNIVKL